MKFYSTTPACDYANLNVSHWVPILAVLCDGNNFEYLVYDSGDRLIYSSGRKVGIQSDELGDKTLLLASLKWSK